MSNVQKSRIRYEFEDPLLKRTRFPEKLYRAACDENIDFIFWSQSGTSLFVHSDDFERNVMQLCPGLVKIPHFKNLRRQFKVYGFSVKLCTKTWFNEYNHVPFVVNIVKRWPTVVQTEYLFNMHHPHFVRENIQQLHLVKSAASMRKEFEKQLCMQQNRNTKENDDSVDHISPKRKYNDLTEKSNNSGYEQMTVPFISSVKYPKQSKVKPMSYKESTLINQPSQLQQIIDLTKPVTNTDVKSTDFQVPNFQVGEEVALSNTQTYPVQNQMIYTNVNSQIFSEITNVNTALPVRQEPMLSCVPEPIHSTLPSLYNPYNFPPWCLYNLGSNQSVNAAAPLQQVADQGNVWQQYNNPTLDLSYFTPFSSSTPRKTAQLQNETFVPPVSDGVQEKTNILSVDEVKNEASDNLNIRITSPNTNIICSAESNNGCSSGDLTTNTGTAIIANPYNMPSPVHPSQVNESSLVHLMM